MAAVLLERFISADCEACWSAGKPPTGNPFVLDWIVPSARGDDAPLAAAALVEARARAGSLSTTKTAERRQALSGTRVVKLAVEDGPAWNGYIGLRLHVQRQSAALPTGTAGYLALVENVQAGDEGTPVERRLVRVLAGPLPLDGTRESTDHLLALRIPQGARIDRLGSIGWVEDKQGNVLALAQAAGPDCPEGK